ncbi:unnamed protein product [marine sediment metagenome]|uniref:Uncharacterized protein n=1 Tax=marine sediment metagenome TaxID=412755 RepID=X1FLQ6_9ZZZZ
MGYKTICKECKKHKRIVGKGVCEDCMAKNLQQNIKQMREKKGPMYEKWKKNLKAGLLKVKKTPDSNVEQSKSIKQIISQAKIRPINLKQCPACLAINKSRAKKCAICRIPFA